MAQDKDAQPQSEILGEALQLSGAKEDAKPQSLSWAAPAGTPGRSSWLGAGAGLCGLRGRLSSAIDLFLWEPSSSKVTGLKLIPTQNL